jgi:hypothetical protein
MNAADSVMNAAGESTKHHATARCPDAMRDRP